MVINRVATLNSVVEMGCRFINNNPSIIKRVFRVNSYNDEPKFYSYGIYFKDKYSDEKNKNELSLASGISFDKNKALIRALGEAIERYSLGGNNNGKFIYGSFNKLKVLGKVVINPDTLALFLNKRHSYNSLSRENFHWVEGKDLISGKEILIPAQLIYVPYLHQYSESLIRFSISTGAAADVTLNGALYRGICEVAERDAFMIAYLNQISSPQVNLISINNNKINNILAIFKRYKLELIVLNITNDLELPVFAAITLDRTGLGPAVSVGLKTGFDIEETIIGAIEESLMTRSWVRDKFIYTDPEYKRRKKIVTIEDRAHFWFSVDSIDYLGFWLNTFNLEKINVEDLGNKEGNLEKAIRLLNKKGMKILYVDITDEIIKKFGFTVIKVVIPQLQPLYLNEKYPYLGGTRIYNIPVKMGILQKPKTKNQLNKIPHPFL